MLPSPLRTERDAASNSRAVHGFFRASVGMPRSLVKKSDFPSSEIRGLYSRAGVLTAPPSGFKGPQPAPERYVTKMSQSPGPSGRPKAPPSRKPSSAEIQASMLNHPLPLIASPRFSGSA